MRIWDIEPELLCRKHLLGEHRELHALWSIVLHGKKGYSQHPETKRWVGKLGALKARHQMLVLEMGKRGYKHQSPLPEEETVNEVVLQDVFVHTVEEQKEILRNKGCGCRI